MRNMVACLTEDHPPAHWVVETPVKAAFSYFILTIMRGNCMLLQFFGFLFRWRRPLPRRIKEMLRCPAVA